MKKTLIIVRSAYQLISTMFVKETICKNDICDLVLDSKVKMLLEFKAVLQKNFNRVILMKDDQHLKISVVDRMREGVCPNLYKTYFDADLDGDYDRVFYYGKTYAVSSYLGTLSKKTKFVKLEDGLASYVSEDTVRIRDRVKHIIFKEFLEKPYQQDMYLMYPELYVGNAKYNIKPLGISEEIQMSIKKKYKSVIKSKDTNLKEQFIFFEEAADQYSDVKQYQDLANAFIDKVGKTNIIVKPHPRNKTKLLNARYWEMDVPWELYCLLYPNKLENKTLVTVCSMTCYTPFLMGVKNIYSWYLYPLYNGNIAIRMHPSFVDFMKLIMNKYPEIKVLNSEQEVTL